MIEKLLLQDDSDLMDLRTELEFEAAGEYLATKLLGRPASVYEADVIERALALLRNSIERIDPKEMGKIFPERKYYGNPDV